jgi:predicted phosphodiesterase
LAGRTLALFHGHEPQFSHLLNYAPHGEGLSAAHEDCDYIIHGHTHIAADVRFGALRLICPGALVGTPRPTVATLDLDIDRVTFLRVQRGREKM